VAGHYSRDRADRPKAGSCRRGCSDGTLEELRFLPLGSGRAVNYFRVLIDPDITLSQRRLLFGHVLLVEDRIIRDFYVIS
jgi:hypothetical protein